MYWCALKPATFIFLKCLRKPISTLWKWGYFPFLVTVIKDWVQKIVTPPPLHTHTHKLLHPPSPIPTSPIPLAPHNPNQPTYVHDAYAASPHIIIIKAGKWRFSLWHFSWPLNVTLHYNVSALWTRIWALGRFLGPRRQNYYLPNDFIEPTLQLFR